MTDSPQWQVGQKVILRERNYGRGKPHDSIATISRVARKYVYVVQHGRETAFDKDTGRERADGMYAAQIYTPESLAAAERLSAALARVGELTRGYGWTRTLSADDLEQIAQIIEAANTRGAVAE